MDATSLKAPVIRTFVCVKIAAPWNFAVSAKQWTKSCPLRLKFSPCPDHQIVWINPGANPKNHLSHSEFSPKFSPKPQRIDGQRQHLRQCRLQHGRQEALQLRAIAWSVTRLDMHFIGSKHANHMAIFLELYIIPWSKKSCFANHRKLYTPAHDQRLQWLGKGWKQRHRELSWISQPDPARLRMATKWGRPRSDPIPERWSHAENTRPAMLHKGRALLSSGTSSSSEVATTARSTTS